MGQWFTLDDIRPIKNDDRLFCLAVDSPGKQFLVGNMGVPTHNTDEGKHQDEIRGEISMIVGSIARLGRAAGVHLVLATQRPDATVIPGEVKANLGVRINCGRTDANASNMILGNGEGTRVRPNPRGRLYLRIYGDGDHGQGFFAKSSWIDEYLASKNLNPDGTPLSEKRSKLATLVDMETFDGADLDTQTGRGAQEYIEQIRREEAGEAEDTGDWGFTEEDVTPDGGTTDEHPAPPPDDRPILGNNKKENQWHRPEDDWDDELEQLINENNS